MGEKNKMTCKETINQLYEYLDNELEEENYSDVKKHLNMCGICSEKFEFEQALKNVIKEKVPLYNVSQQTKESIVKKLSELNENRIRTLSYKPGREEERGFLGIIKLRPVYAIAAVTLPFLISAISIYLVFFKPQDDSLIVKGAVECHDKFVNDKMLLSLVSQDRNKIQGYFTDKNKYDFVVNVPKSNGHTIKFSGCKNCYLAGKRSAYIGIEGRLNKVSLEMTDGSNMNINHLKKRYLEGRKYYIGRHKGYNVVLWKHGNTLCSLTSDMNIKDLVYMADRSICSNK